MEKFCPKDYPRVSVQASPRQRSQNMRTCVVPNDHAYPQCLAKVEVSLLDSFICIEMMSLFFIDVDGFIVRASHQAERRMRDTQRI